MTPGELADFIKANRERERLEAQRLSIIAFNQAGLIASSVFGGTRQEIYDVFPFWDEGEIKEIRIARIRKTMESYVAKSKGAGKNVN